MKDFTIILLIVLSMTSCTNGQKGKLTADEIWNKYLDALGKKETVLGIKSVISTYIFESKKYGNTNSKVISKYPDKLYLEMQFSNNVIVTYVINGNKGIVKFPNEIKSLTEKELLGYKPTDLFYPEMYYKQFGYKMELMDDEIIDNKKYYNIKVVADTKTIYYQINKDNFQLFRKVTDNYIIEINETFMMDGVRLIKTARSISQADTSLQFYKSYLLNTNVNDSIFDLK